MLFAGLACINRKIGMFLLDGGIPSTGTMIEMMEKSMSTGTREEMKPTDPASCVNFKYLFGDWRVVGGVVVDVVTSLSTLVCVDVQTIIGNLSILPK